MHLGHHARDSSLLEATQGVLSEHSPQSRAPRRGTHINTADHTVALVGGQHGPRRHPQPGDDLLAIGVHEHDHALGLPHQGFAELLRVVFEVLDGVLGKGGAGKLTLEQREHGDVFEPGESGAGVRHGGVMNDE